MEEYFKQLISSAHIKSSFNAEKQLNNIKYCFFNDDLDEDTINLYVLLTFDETNGLLSYINKAAQDKSLDKTVSLSLEFLYELINNLRYKLSNQLPQIVNICLYVCRTKTSANTKQKAFNVIKLILQLKCSLVEEILEKLKTFLKDQINLKDKSSMVASGVATTFALLSKNYPSYTSNDIELFQYLVSELSEHVHGKKSSVTLIEGLFNALNDCLCTFQPDISEINTIYNAVKEYVVFDSSITKKVANRAALHVFTQHSELFSKLIPLEVFWWEETLMKWVDATSPDDFKPGMLSFNVFQLELIKLLSDTNESHKPIFDHFFKNYTNKFYNHRSIHNIRLFINGLGLLGEVCCNYMTMEEVNDLFIKLIQRVEYIYNLNQESCDKNLDNLPDYIKMLSSYLKHISEFDRNHIKALQGLTILLIRLYPKMHVVHNNLVIDSLIITFHSVSKSKFLLKDFLQDVLYQGVTWTCSYPTISETSNIENHNFFSYKSFLPLWKSILSKKAINQIYMQSFDDINYDQLEQEVFDELIRVLFDLINKLNINIKIKDDLASITDPDDAMEVVQENDYAMFINLIEFYVDLLPSINNKYFHSWIDCFTNHLIGKSLKHSLISGFYKLLAVDLKIIDILDYFHDLEDDSINALYQTILNFLLIMLKRMQQYKGDLLLSCMELILSTPTCLISELNFDFSDLFISVFTIGRSYYKIASVAIDTLERWNDSFDKEIMLPLLKKVVPSLDGFLRSKYLSGYVDNSLTLTKTKRSYKKQKLYVDTAPELLSLQKKILKFLGNMPKDICFEFVNANLVIETLPWCKDTALKLSLPYARTNVTLHLEKYLLRTIELAMHCSDRKTKVAACEFLHGTIMFILGSYAQMSSKIDDLNIMLVKCVNAALILACDNDLFVRQLFHPLLIQMMHWLSHSGKVNLDTSVAILEVLLDGVTNLKDASVRDFSGACLKEFIIWTRKQLTSRELQNNLNALDKIIDKFKYFSMHPDPIKRLGATIIFNNIYTELREEEFLISKYWFDILSSFLINISMVDYNDEESDYLRNVQLGLDHLLRVYIEKANFFNNLRGDGAKDLKYVANCLLMNTHSINVHCRRKSMKMFIRIIPLVNNIDIEQTICDTFANHFNQKLNHQIFKSVHMLFSEMQDILRTIDIYIFLMENNFLQSIDYSKLMSAVNYYLDNLQTVAIAAVIMDSTITRDAKETFNYIKVLIAQRNLFLARVILKIKTAYSSLESTYFQDSFWTFLCNFIFNSVSLGIDRFQSYQCLSGNDDLLKEIIEKLPEDKLNQFQTFIKTYLTSHMKNYNSLDTLAVIPYLQRQILKGLLFLSHTKLKNILPNFTEGLLDVAITNLIEASHNKYQVKKLSQTVQDYCTLIIQLAAEQDEQLLKLMQYLADDRIIQGSSKLFGLVIYENYHKILIPAIIKKKYFEKYLEILFISKLEFISMLHNTLKYITKSQEFSRIEKEYVAKVFQEKFISSIITDDWKLESILETIRTYSFLTKQPCCDSLIAWFINLLKTPDIFIFNKLKSIIETLGFIASSTSNSNLLDAFYIMRNNHLELFTLPERKSTTSLIIKAALNAAVYSKSSDLLGIAFDLICCCRNDFEIDIPEHIIRMLDKTSNEQQMQLLTISYKMSQNNTIIGNERLRISKYVVILIQNCSYEVFEKFFIEIINELMDSFKTSQNGEELLKKIVYLRFVCVLFARINQEHFVEKSCPITKARFGERLENGRMLLKALIKICVGIRKEIKSNECDSDLFRLYQCEAYNASVSIICNTRRDDITFYNILLHHEDSEKCDILWSKVIDLNKSYNFSLSYDDLPKRIKVLVNVRTNQQQQQNMKYIETQHLFKSSLVEDVTRYDLTTTMVRSIQDVEADNNRENDIQVELLNEDINNEECMSTICAVFQQMANYDLFKFETDDLPPSWVLNIRNLLLNENVHKNVKLFLAKAIFNCKELLKMFGSWFMGPIINIISGKLAGDTFNSFVADITIMLVTSWSTCNLLDEDKEFSEKLILFLIERIYNDRNDIFKYNLSIFKQLIEKWQDFKVPHELILEYLDKPKQLAGIHIINILLANNITPWGEKLKTFAKKLSECLNSTHRNIYHTCAETIGLALKYVEHHPTFSSHLNNFEKVVNNILQHISTTNTDKLSYCLDGISKHYPSLCEKFFSTTVYNMNSLPPVIKCFYLRIYLKCTDQISTNLMKMDLNVWLSDNNSEVQILVLELIKNVLDAMSVTELEALMQKLCSFVDHKNKLCRNMMHDLLILIYRKFCLSEDVICQKIVDSAKDILIQGLIDNEPEIQAKLLQFWSENETILDDIEQLVLYILENLHKTSTEHMFISYFCNIALIYLKNSSDFDKPIFDYPLHECRFEDYQLSSSWKTQHAFKTPFLSSTLSQNMENCLRATQSQRNFRETQTNTLQSQTNSFLESSSSLLIDTFKHPGVVTTETQSNEPYELASRRFMKKDSDVRRFHAHRQIKKGIQKIVVRKENVQKKQTDVKIYRKYRKGDYPDIEMKLLSLIETLEGLVKSDAQIAKILFIEIIDAAIINAKKPAAFIIKAQKAINNIFENTNEYTTSLMSALIEIALLNKETLVFDPKVISSICHYSGLMSLGCLLIEEYLSMGLSTGESSTKKSISLYNSETIHWMKLAELYKTMEEWDVVHGIFMHKIPFTNTLSDVYETVKCAITAESQGLWKSAQEFYKTAINSENEYNEFYYEAYFKCSAQLSDWEKVDRQITVALNCEDVWSQLWRTDWNRQKLLPYYLTAQIRLALKTPSATNQLLTSMNRYLDNDEYSMYLKTNFSEDLAFVGVIGSDINLSKKLLNNSLSNFLNDWRCLNPLFSLLRVQKCLNLQNIIEIQTFIECFDKLTIENASDLISDMRKRWLKTQDDNITFFIPNETRYLYKRSFIEALKNKLLKFNATEENEQIEMLKEMKFQLDYNFTNVCLRNNNYIASKKYLNQIVKVKKNERIEYLINHLLSKFNFLQARQQTNDDKKFESLRNALDCGLKCMGNSHFRTNGLLMLEHSMLLNDISQEFTHLTVNDISSLHQLVSGHTINSLNDLEAYGLEFINQAIADLSLSTERAQYLGDAHYKLASFMVNKGELYERNLIEHTFRAMKYESKDARLLFSHLLNLKSISDTHRDIFIFESENVPSWMFLYWIPQLLAYLDTDKINATDQLVLRLVKDYPNAFVYPYKLSKEKYNFEGKELHKKSLRNLCEKMDSLLSNTLIDKMMDALSYLRTLKYSIKMIQEMILSSTSSEDTFRKEGNKILSKFFEMDSNYYDTEASGGLINKDLKEYYNNYLKLVKGPFNIQKIKEALMKIECKKTDSEPNLGYYSPWLKNFRGDNYKEEIEIPGQYSGDQKPLPQYHIKISGFSSKVKVFESIRQPIRLTILGNNIKEYMFLVKQGEDLRQDQRIMQLYDLMNGIFNADSICSQRKLNIYTYKVIPISTSLGLIKWVDNTIKFGEFIKKPYLVKGRPKSGNIFAKVQEKHNIWINKARKSESERLSAVYANALLKYNKTQAITFYRSLINEIPSDALRKSFWNVCVDAANFFAIRKVFICNYATMCIADWLLGIGDRHLSNILLSAKDGRVVGIDFGYAFGTAIQELQVPELLPIRLTPQIVNLMQPLCERGFLQEAMVHALRALRKNKDKLLLTMHVCLQEPTINWLESANRMNDTRDGAMWHAEEKIKLVKWKFEGGDPVKIMIKEIESRRSDRAACREKLVEYFMEIMQFKDKNVLTADEQVISLIAVATDYNLAPRMYCGWEPWI